MKNTAELLRLIHNLIRLGTVEHVDLASARCRVKFGEIITGWIPWISQRSGETKVWSPPTLGEQVLVLSPGGDHGCAVAICGLFSASFPAPSASSDVFLMKFPDGALLQYDYEQHHLKATIPGSAELEASDGVTIKADTVIDGSLSVSGDVTFDGGSVSHKGKNIGENHVHIGVQSGASNTGAPA